MNTADNQATGTADTIDILSNGFKCRSSSGDVNDGTNTYVYCAWAEAPAVDLFGGNVNGR